MKARRRGGPYRWAVIALLLAGVWLLARETAEDRVLEQLEKALSAASVRRGEPPTARRQRLARVFPEVFAARAEATIPDFPDASGGRDRLTRAAAAAAADYAEVSLRLESPTVRFDSSGQWARVQARILVSGRSPAKGLRTDDREVHLRLHRSGSSWHIVSLTVGPASRAEPEPRP